MADQNRQNRERSPPNNDDGNNGGKIALVIVGIGVIVGVLFAVFRNK